MLEKKTWRQKYTLVYPQHAFDPKDWLGFLELRPFEEGWKELGMTDDDLDALQVMIMLRPKGHPVVPGTGGLRKLRFSAGGSSKGKRGGARIGYVFLEEVGIVILVIAYAKSEKDNLSPAEVKAIRELIARIKREFETGVIR